MQWTDIPEVAFPDFGAAEEAVAQFRSLARRPRDHGHGVFCMTVVRVTVNAATANTHLPAKDPSGDLG